MCQHKADLGPYEENSQLHMSVKVHDLLDVAAEDHRCLVLAQPQLAGGR